MCKSALLLKSSLSVRPSVSPSVRKWYACFYLVPNSVTLNDLEGRNGHRRSQDFLWGFIFLARKS